MSQVVVIACPLAATPSTAAVVVSHFHDLKQRLQSEADIRVYIDASKERPVKIVLIGDIRQLPQIKNAVFTITRDIRLFISELWEPQHLPSDSLMQLLSDKKKRKELALGMAEVERMLQRRKLSLLVIANDLDTEHRETLSRIINNQEVEIPILVSELSRSELGIYAGVKRASIIGVKHPRPQIYLGS